MNDVTICAHIEEFERSTLNANGCSRALSYESRTVGPQKGVGTDHRSSYILMSGARVRDVGLTLTAGATPARGSRWRVETALALRGRSRAAGLPKEGATG